MQTPDSQVAEIRRTYVANLAALYASDPRLAAEVEAVPFASLPKLEPTRDGRYTVRVPADDDKPVYLHSRYAPANEAQTLIVSQVERADANRAARRAEWSEEGGAEEEAPGVGRDELQNQCFVLAGLGLGYHVAALEQRYPRPLLIVAEPDRALLKLAMCVTDFAPLLDDGRLTFITEADRQSLHERIHAASGGLMLGITFITPPAAARLQADFHARARAVLKDFVAFARVQVFTLLRLARKSAENVAYNLPAYLGGPGVEVLEKRASGFPAILVAAGPSLARNIDQLKELQSRAVIIAVQTVFKMLRARGITPHFVCSLDYHEISAQFFHDVADCGATALVAEPKAHWRVLDAYRGRRHVLHSGTADNLLRGSAPHRGALRAGSTVAHLAFYLAEHLGCDPILLLGQDLSYTDGLYYPAGTQIERIWQPEFGRFSTVEMKQWERIARTRHSARKVLDIHGRTTYTEEAMFVYAEQFQSDFATTRARVIHATEGGMRLTGTEVMTLRDAAAQFCTRELPADLFEMPATPPDARGYERAIEELVQRAAEVQEIREIARDTVTLLDQLKELVERPAEFNRLVARVDEMRARLGRNDRTYELVRQVSQVAELRRLQADRGIRDDVTETPAMTRRRLLRDREYVSSLIESCEFLLNMLPAATERLRGVRP